MYKVIIFGGTTEGRQLAEYCAFHEIPALVSVVSSYGAELVKENSWVNVCQGARNKEEIEDLLGREHPLLVIDATHPYAAAVTDNLQQACRNQNTEYIRVTRESRKAEEKGRKAEDRIVWVKSAGEAADYLSSAEGNILLTTGSKDLAVFSRIKDFGERVFARVLPNEQSLAMCRAAGLGGRRIIAMQGPFSAEMNLALIAMTKAEYLVTKESGAAGGFQEKIEAVFQAGIKAVVIGRPVKPEGITAAEAMERLRPYGNMFKRRVWLVGIGMGGEGQMTLEAAACLEKTQAVAGAKRMLESVSKWCGGKEIFASYKPDEILGWLENHPHIEDAAVVFSGDTGFYSGAKAMAETLSKYPDRYERVMLPGISTLSCLCARLGTSWEDVYAASLHGRQMDGAALLKRYKRVFLLMEGRESVEKLCRQLNQTEIEHIQISAGTWLSYPQEKVVTGTAREMEMILKDMDEGGLWAVLIEQG